MRREIVCKVCGMRKAASNNRQIYCFECQPAAKKKNDVKWRRDNSMRDAETKRMWSQRNKVKANEIKRRWAEKNREKALATKLRWQANNLHLARAASRRWYNAHLVEARKSAAVRMKRRLEENITARLHSRISNYIRYSLMGAKRNPIKEILEYSIDELQRHLERQFSEGINWNNYGRGERCWHIDHILPVSMFSYNSTECDEFKQCWALTNLRPLWEPDNLAKSAKRLHLL